MINQIIVRTTTDRKALHNVEASITPVAVFERAGIRYDGTTAIIVAGHPISSSQAYRPLSEIIGTENYEGSVTVAAIAKHDNALKVQVIGKNMFVYSSASIEQIEDLARWNPEALSAMEDGVEFNVYVGEGTGNLTQTYAEFAEDEIEGKAYIQLGLPDEMTKEEFLEDFTTLEVSHNLWMLQEIEKGYEEAMKLVDIRKNQVVNCFEDTEA